MKKALLFGGLQYAIVTHYILEQTFSYVYCFARVFDVKCAIDCPLVNPKITHTISEALSDIRGGYRLPHTAEERKERVS